MPLSGSPSDWACDYLNARAKGTQPFFLYLAYNAPHDPVQPPPEFLVKVRLREPQMDEKRAKLVALIEHMDAGIGRVLDALDKNGQAQDTLIMFSSDNGGLLPSGANNGPWRSGKTHMYEGGLRVPFIARWPARIKPGSVNKLNAMSMDMFPTALEAAELKLPTNIDGISFLPALLGREHKPIPRDYYFVRREGGPQYGGKTIEALQHGDWKLIQDSPLAPLELYNLADDPFETTDLAAQKKPVVAELHALLRKQIQRGGAVPWQAAAK